MFWANTYLVDSGTWDKTLEKSISELVKRYPDLRDIFVFDELEETFQ